MQRRQSQICCCTLQPIEIGGEQRADIGAYRGGAGAFEFADFRQHLARQVDLHLGQRLAQRGADAAFVRIVKEREHERYGDGLQIGVADRLDQRGEFIVGQGGDDGALGVDALGDFVTEAARYQHVGRVLQQIVEIGAGGAAQLQQVAEAARGDEAGAGAVFFQQRVGHHGGGVGQQRHVGRIDRIGVECLANASDDGLAEIRWCGGDFCDLDASAGFIDQGDVGEGAADVDADAPRHQA